jgi:transglutaminase-like putative cysteine protease
MRLSVRHRTAYDYEHEAVFSQHLLRLTPEPGPGQQVIETSLSITPEPDSLERHRDMFGNWVHVVTLSRPHDGLEIVAGARIERQERTAMIFDASAPWEEVRDAALGIRSTPNLTSIAPFAFPSAMTGPDTAIETYMREVMPPGTPVLVGAEALCRRIYEDFTYKSGATGADTMPVESFATREGVCQDFAHIMLAALRSLRLPARYVSGYLRTIPPEGQERLEGADASHAWVSVWEPAFGWIDFDPTNDMVPSTDHVALAHGRDYRDVSPVSGVVIGAGAQKLDVGVDVVATE